MVKSKLNISQLMSFHKRYGFLNVPYSRHSAKELNIDDITTDSFKHKTEQKSQYDTIW